MKVLLLVGLLPLLICVPFANDDENQGGTASSPNSGFTTTPSGLKYRVIKKSAGKKPAPDSKVTVHYVGTLENGKVIDSSRKRGQPSEFALNAIIVGWREGLQLMSPGATYEFIIPPELGYGNQETGQIPANSTTFWEVELIRFK